MDSNEGMCPWSYYVLRLYSTLTSPVAPGGMPWTSSRTRVPHTSPFQFPCGLWLTLWPTIGTLGLFLTKVHLTKSQDVVLRLISSRLAPIISVNIKKKNNIAEKTLSDGETASTFPRQIDTIPASLFPALFSVLSSLTWLLLPQDFAQTPLPPGNVLCYSKWPDGEGPWTHPKPLQKNRHPYNFPFPRSTLSALYLTHLQHDKVWLGNEHKKNPRDRSTFHFSWRKLSPLGPEAPCQPFECRGERSVTSASPRQTQPPWHHHTWPHCLSGGVFHCLRLWSFCSCLRVLNLIRAILSCFCYHHAQFARQDICPS